MADPDRNDVMMDFQACTGIEDIESAIEILEANNWNLLDSINAVMPHLGSQSLPSEDRPAAPPPTLPVISGSQADPVVLGPSPTLEPRPALESIGIPTVEPRWSSLAFDMDEAGPSQIRQRFLNFSIDYRDRTIPLVVSDGDSVGKMKKILGEELSLPPESLNLQGWKREVTDRSLLRDLHLPKENRLFLLTPDIGTSKEWETPETGLEHLDVLDRLQLTFTLLINVDSVDCDAASSSSSSSSSIPNSVKNPLKLRMPGSKTVGEVMSDVYDLTNIPVRHQQWTGWPSECANDPTMTLAGATGIQHPTHGLILRKKLTTTTTTTTTTTNAAAPSSSSTTRTTRSKTTTRSSANSSGRSTPDAALSDDSDMELESPFVEDDFPAYRPTPNSLIPEDESLNETEASESFAAEFISRYGEIHPVFFIGSLEDAIKNSCAAPIRERRPLAIYLHHDNSVLANVFCSQILCAESVVNYLSSNFVTWGWDLTFESNKAKLLTMVTRHFGSVAASTIRNFKADQLPVLIVITRQRGINEVSSVIQGKSTLDELMTNLIASHEVFAETIQVEMGEALEREERERVRTEQEAAFQESLAIDRAKEEAKKDEEKRVQQEIEREELMRLAEQKREAHEKELRTAIQKSIQDILPDEPAEDSPEPLSKIRVRKPDGEFLLRRFRASAPLIELFQFTASKGFPVEEFKVIRTYPRRDLTADPTDMRKTFQDMKLCPQETVFLEER